MKNKVFFNLLVLVFVATIKVTAEETYWSGYQPPLPEAFPRAYKDYQILPGTISPNGKLAVIYPKCSLLDSKKANPLYLAQLTPFAIIVKIPYENIAFNHGGYDSEWAKDGTFLIFKEVSKWGPDRVSLVPIQNGKAGKVLDLTAEVRKKLKPYFTKAHVKRYNDYYDFIFDSDGYPNRWHPISGRVEIKCFCTSNTTVIADPDQPRPKKWEADFEGIWDVAKGRFLHFNVEEYDEG